MGGEERNWEGLARPLDLGH